MSPPIKAVEGGGKVRDRYGEGFGFYDEVGVVLGGVSVFGFFFDVSLPEEGGMMGVYLYGEGIEADLMYS